MKKYLVVSYWLVDGEIDFDILETDKEEGTEDFEQLIEQYEHNQNTVFYSEVTPKLIEKLKTLIGDLKCPTLNLL